MWLYWASEWEANEKVSFDGVNRRITVNDDVVTIDVGTEIYSAWKRWMVRDINSRFVPAMRATGGDPTGSGQTTGNVYFMINNWQVVVNHPISLTGILYSDDYDTPYIIGPGGGVIAKVSNLAIGYSTTGGSGSDLTAAQVWSYGSRTLTATPTYNGPTVAQIRQEMDLYSEKLIQIKAILDGINIPTAVNIRQEIDTNSVKLQEISNKQSEALTVTEFLALSG